MDPEGSELALNFYDILDYRDEVTDNLDKYMGFITECSEHISNSQFTWKSPIDRTSTLIPKLEIKTIKKDIEDEETSVLNDNETDSSENIYIEYTQQLVTRLLYAVNELEHSTRNPPIPIRDNTNKRYLLQLGSPILPTASPICPTLKDVELLISKSKLFISVYSVNGYNFSSEYIRVYKGELKWKTAYTDFIGIIKRALLQIDPSLTGIDAMNYTIYILRICAWESKLSLGVAQATIENEFPDLHATIETRNEFKEVKVFIGLDDEFRLYFWVRLLLPIIPTAISTEQPSTESSERNDYIDVCYNKRYFLSREEVDELDTRGLADTGQEDIDLVPLPPPKPTEAADIGLYILYDKIYREQSNFHDLLDDTLQEDFDIGVLIDGNIRDQTSSCLKPKPLAYLNINTAYCSDLFGWGENSELSLGCASPGVLSPQLIPIPATLALERVRTIACSPRHTLILSYIGNIYACGENSEGALGLGDTASRSKFTLLMLPMSTPPKFIKLAAGSTNIGSHSMAITNTGILYSWGVCHATGLGSLKEQVLLPQKVQTFPLNDTKRYQMEEVDGERIDEDTEQTEEEEEEEEQTRHLVSDVACGGGFTVCIMKSGRVAVWGLWAQCRLGLGPTPLTNTRF